MTAVLYLLKPEFFKISDAEKDAKEKEMAKNGAEEAAVRGADHFPGDHRIITHYVETGGGRKGSVLLAKQGNFYAITYKTGENPAWQGIGVKVALPNGDQELWAGVAPGGTVSLGIYGIKGGALSGTWLPINAADDKSVFGFENLVGSPTLAGVYKITGGKLPNGGVAYTGALNIDPLSQALNSDGKCYRFRWATGTTGLAFRAGDRLAVAAGWGADFRDPPPHAQSRRWPGRRFSQQIGVERVLHARSIVHCPAVRRGANRLLRFRRDFGFSGAGGHGLFKSPPGEHRALHPLREFSDALQQAKIAQRPRRIGDLDRHQIAKVPKHRFRIGPAFSFELHRHQGRRRLADRAALPGELDLLHAPVRAKAHRELNLVPARRIVAMHLHGALGDFAEISRPLGVVEDDLLIKVFQFGVHEKKRRAASRISIMRSISAVVL